MRKESRRKKGKRIEKLKKRDEARKTKHGRGEREGVV